MPFNTNLGRAVRYRSVRRWVAGVGLTLSAILPGVLTAQLPRVHVIATGGTISNLGDGRRTGEELVAAIPAIGRIARVTIEQFSNVASGSITEGMWRDMATRIRKMQSEADAPVGFIVTHGTDTMEETAYFLSLTVGGCTPIIVTGAMRQANAVGADGPANLLNAIRTAVAPASRGRGTMVLMNDELFAARDVAKTNTTRLNAFTAPDAGVLGLADPDTVVYHRGAPQSGATCRRSAFDVGTLPAFPRVDVIYAHIGGDSVQVDASVAAGARALIIAGVGRGGTTPSQSSALRRAREKGVLVVTSNRTGSGRVGGGFRADSTSMGSGDLNPQKARIIVMLGLAAKMRPAEIVSLLESR